MRIAILVNDVDTEVPPAATTAIARAATRLGHEVYLIGMGDLTYHPDGRIGGVARVPVGNEKETKEEFLAQLQGRDAKRQDILITDLDVLYLRYNPIEDPGGPLWGRDSGIVFGQLALRQGVLVLNDPFGLASTLSKMYLEHFPASVRPAAIVTRSADEVARFYEEQNGRLVLKPVHGYGGKDVYLLRGDTTNLKQIVESIARSSYVIAQEYLEAAPEGDTRLFLLNGRPLQWKGRYAAVLRVSESEDFRNNMSAGAKPRKAEITPRMLELAELVRPRLLANGLFEVGIDVIGDKIVEINPISSGGLNAAGVLEGVDFGEAVVRAIERKVEYRREHGDRLDNRELAVLE